MDIKKECMVCKNKLGNNGCKLCGKIVCKDHYDSENGICIECKKGLKV